MQGNKVMGLVLSLVLGLGAGVAAAQDVVLRVGDQKGNARSVMEAAGVLNDLPYKVEWNEFPNAAPLLEAMKAGALDAGSVGDAPLTFAAANGLQAKAITATVYEGNGIIVRDGDAIHETKDLAGKKVALVRGSAGHSLLLNALRDAGLSEDAVELVFLPPAEATLALTSGSVDAVSTWEPFVSFAVLQSGARLLVDGKNYPILSYLIASNDAIATKPEALRDFVSRLVVARQWGVENTDSYAKVIAQLVGLPDEVALGKQRREGHRPHNIDAEVIKIQQATINFYLDAGLITTPLKATDLLDDSFNPKGGQ